MLNLKADKALLDRLKNSVTRKLSAADMEKQRASFVRGSIGAESGLASTHGNGMASRKDRKAPAQ